MNNAIKLLSLTFLSCSLIMSTMGAETSTPKTADANPTRENYSPYADRDFPENLYWGDTHVHSSRSFDAFTMGMGNRLDPDTAYRFARGETVDSHNGKRLRITKPLDFFVLSDHAEYMGALLRVQQRDAVFLETELGKRWHKQFQKGNFQQIFKDFQNVVNGMADREPGSMVLEKTVEKSIWDEAIAAAEKYNEPGKFTTFIGYEWTSIVNGGNLHRNVIFRDSADKVGQVLPFSSIHSGNPEDLWRWMQAYEAQTSGKILAIPHNGNLSNGAMFANKTFAGNQLTRAYAKTRSRWEPLYEVTQVKGDGEAHPYLSPDDGFADFETWDYGGLSSPVISKEPWMLKHEYARSALKLGLKNEQELGANPFKFGLIGSTDTHTGFANAAENNFFGKFAEEEPISPKRIQTTFKPTGNDALPGAIGLSAAGYAAVWAHENTRASIFDAMQRKETYATTGPRIVLRFFGGWNFAEDTADRPDYVRIGYEQGVPMGSDLINAPEGEAPEFLIVASKDPQGANLDRIQVIKGWLDQKGELHEKVYDVALSNGHKVNRKGKAKPLEHTVNLKTATYTNSIGNAQLATVWQDPDFDPGERAFYYIKVLEIPTPRWSTYDSVFFNEPLSNEVPSIIQERAYSSPIWYTP